MATGSYTLNMPRNDIGIYLGLDILAADGRPATQYGEHRTPSPRDDTSKVGSRRPRCAGLLFIECSPVISLRSFFAFVALIMSGAGAGASPPREITGGDQTGLWIRPLCRFRAGQASFMLVKGLDILPQFQRPQKASMLTMEFCLTIYTKTLGIMLIDKWFRQAPNGGPRRVRPRKTTQTQGSYILVLKSKTGGSQKPWFVGILCLHTMYTIYRILYTIFYTQYLDPYVYVVFWPPREARIFGVWPCLFQGLETKRWLHGLRQAFLNGIM